MLIFRFMASQDALTWPVLVLVGQLMSVEGMEDVEAGEDKAVS